MKVATLVRAHTNTLLRCRTNATTQQVRAALSSLALQQPSSPRSPTTHPLLLQLPSLSNHTSDTRRSFVTATSARWSSASASATPSAATAAPAAATTPPAAGSAASEATANDDVDSVTIDLSTIGAETTRVLTIADVLSAREQHVAAKRSAELFEEWESIAGSQSVHDAIALMVKCNMRSLIVTEESAGIVGIITERDVLRKTSPRTILTTETTVRDIMSSHIMCVPPTTTVIDALATMTKENIRHLAVINSEVGSNTVKIDAVPEDAMRCVLSIKDIVKAYAEFEAEKKALAAPPKEEATDDGAAMPSVADVLIASNDPSAASSSPSSPTTANTAEDAAAAAAKAKAAVTAATLLKKKHKKINLILNTRDEDAISVADAVDAMAKQNFGAVLVVDKEQRVTGIFTERDYLAKVLYYKEEPATIRMIDVSTRDVASLEIDDSLEKCWSAAATHDFRHFPVVGVMRKDREYKELAGILSIKDIVREIAKEHHTTPGFKLMEFFKSKMEPTKDKSKVVEKAVEKEKEPVQVVENDKAAEKGEKETAKESPKATKQ